MEWKWLWIGEISTIINLKLKFDSLNFFKKRLSIQKQSPSSTQSFSNIVYLNIVLHLKKVVIKKQHMLLIKIKKMLKWECCVKETLVADESFQRLSEDDKVLIKTFLSSLQIRFKKRKHFKTENHKRKFKVLRKTNKT